MHSGEQKPSEEKSEEGFRHMIRKKIIEPVRRHCHKAIDAYNEWQYGK